MRGTPDGRRILAVNVLSGAGAQLLTAVAALWSIPELVRVIGPAGYGTYAIASGLLGYMSVADLGLSNATLQRLARARATNDTAAFGRTVGTSTALLGGMGVLLAIILLAAAPYIGPPIAGSGSTAAERADVIQAIRWCGVGSLPVFLRPVLEAMVSAVEQLTGFYAATTLANIVRTVGAVFAVWIWPSAVTAVIVLVLASTLQFVILIPLAARAVPELRLEHVRVSRAELRELFRVSLPIWASLGIASIANQLDRFVVSGWFGLTAVGEYSIARDLATRLWILPYTFMRAYFPRVARELAHEEPRAHTRTLRDYGIASLLSSAIPAVPLAMLASGVIAAWTGRGDMLLAAPTFVWLSAGVVANCASLAPLSILQVKVRTRDMIVTSALLLVGMVAGCAVLPRLSGPLGVAISWAVAQGASALLIHVFVWRRDRVSFAADIARCIVASFVVVAAAYWFEAFARPADINLRLGTIARLLPLLPRLAGCSLLGVGAALLLFISRLRQVRPAE